MHRELRVLTGPPADGRPPAPRSGRIRVTAGVQLEVADVQGVSGRPATGGVGIQYRTLVGHGARCASPPGREKGRRPRPELKPDEEPSG